MRSSNTVEVRPLTDRDEELLGRVLAASDCLWYQRNYDRRESLSEGEIVGEDVAVETARTIENIEAILATAGGGLEDVVTVTIFLVDMAHFDAVNACLPST